MMITAADNVWKLKIYRDVATHHVFSESYGKMMRGGIDIEAAVQPVHAKLIRVQTRLSEDSKTLEEAARTAVVRIQ